MTGLLRQLRPEEWQRQTICPQWDIRSMAAHVLGMAEAQASFRQFARDYRTASKRDGGPMIDAMTAAQVRERAALRLPRRHHLYPRHLDAPARHLPRRRP